MIVVFFSRQTLMDRNDQNRFRVVESEGDGIFQGCAPEAVEVLESGRGLVLRSKDGCVLAYIHVRFGAFFWWELINTYHPGTLLCGMRARRSIS